MFLRRVVRYVVWRHLVRLPRLTYLPGILLKTSRSKRVGHLARHRYCPIPGSHELVWVGRPWSAVLTWLVHVSTTSTIRPRSDAQGVIDRK